MPDMSKYLDTTGERAERAWQRIQERPAAIIIVRGKSTVLDPQTVRVEYMSAQRAKRGEDDSESSTRDIYVFGIQSHETLTDTDIKRGDRFTFNDQIWQVDSIAYYPGQIQAKGVVSE